MIVVLAVAALVLLGWSCWDFAPGNNSWIVLAILALLTAPIMIFVPPAETFVCVGEAYLMAIALIYGISTCVVASALYACLILLMTARGSKIFMNVFNVSLLLCDAFLYSAAYQLIKPKDPHGMAAMMFPLAIMAFASFLFTSLLTATAVSWRRGNPILGFWARTYSPLLPNSLIAAAIAGGIAVWFRRSPLVVLAFLPAFLLIFWWTTTYRNRLMRKTKSGLSAQTEQGPDSVGR